jgi:hypothetical protein
MHHGGEFQQFSEQETCVRQVDIQLEPPVRTQLATEFFQKIAGALDIPYAVVDNVDMRIFPVDFSSADNQRILYDPMQQQVASDRLGNGAVDVNYVPALDLIGHGLSWSARLGILSFSRDILRIRGRIITRKDLPACL